MIDALKHARAEFEITFGRPPRKVDPVFAGRYYISVADMRRETLRAMRKAGISPALQYAYRKTDFLVMDPKLPSAKELDEYERAIDEFYTAADSGIPLSELIDSETPEQFMHEQLQRIQVIGGYFIEKHFNRFRSRKTENPNVEVKFIVGFAMTNFVRCLRSVLIMLDNGVAFDGFNLVRCLCKNYMKSGIYINTLTALKSSRPNWG